MAPTSYSLANRLAVFLSYIRYAVLGLFCGLAFGVIVVVGIPVYLFRSVLTLLSKYVRPDLGKVLDPLSSILVGELLSTKPPRTNIIVPLTLDKNISLEEFEKIVLDKWINAKVGKGEFKYPQFRQFPVPWLGFMFWKIDTHFNIKNHVHCHPSKDIVTDKELNDFIEGLLNAPHHRTRSPWEFHILQNYRNPAFHNGEMSVLVLKVHHSLADGYSILNAIVRDIFGSVEFKLPHVNYPKKTCMEKIIYAITVPFAGVYELSKILLESFKNSPWKIPDTEKAWHQLYAKSELIPIENIKHIKNTFGVSFTSVLLSGISLGIHKNLESKRENKTLRVENESDKMCCLSTLPLPPKGRKDLLTNYATGAIYHIPTGSFETSLDRLAECNKILDNTKKSVVPAITNFFVTASGCHLRWVSRFFGNNRMIPTGLSNFPSVDENAIGDVAGRQCLFAEFTVGGLEGVAGVAFMVISYRKHIRVAVTAEGGLLSRNEVDALVKCIEREVSHLFSLSNSNEQKKRNLM